MYTTPADYEAYTGTTAPVDYERQELYATTLFKSLYPNFPSETQYNELDTATMECIEKAIFEQISFAGNTDFYGGGSGGAESFSVGNFSITDATENAQDRVGFMAMTFLETCGATYKGVGTAC